jgi:NAD(P)-dependent dehydrogenase (short-subunit alcohol dehydrogenase family)
MSSRVAVITGGASGLGLAIARALGVDGWSVALLDANPQTLAASVELLRAAGIDVEGFHASVADGAAVDDAVARIVQRWHRIDALFANAGISAGPGPGAGGPGIAEVDDANWDHVLAVNLSGVMRSIRACVPHLRAAGGGSIVITSSSAAVRPTLWVGHAYTAAKAALIPLGKAMAIELAGDGIRVNVIAPGAFVTDIGGGRLRDPQVAQSMTRSIPMRRLGDPEEVGDLARFLAGDESRYISGAVISIDGALVAGEYEPVS